MPSWSWKLHDPDLSEDWEMPRNPNKMTSPHPPKNAVIFSRASGTTGLAGNGISRVLIFRQEPYQWQFSGQIRSEQHFLDFEYWTKKINRLHLTDHLNRVWEIRMESTSLDEKKPSHLAQWRYDYTVTTNMYGRIS